MRALAGLSLIVLLLVWLLTACGAQHAAGTVQHAPPPVDSVPFPDDRWASALTAYQLLGREALQHSSHAALNGDALSLPAASGKADYAVYRFKPPTAPDHVQVSLGAGTTGAWVGLADFTTQRWAFAGPFSSSQQFTLSSAVNVSPAGNIYIAVLASPGDPATVDMLQLYAQNIPPTADFTPTPPSGPTPLSVDFDASASTDQDGTVVRYEWDFDNDGIYEVDGQTSPLAQNVFTGAGTYHVSLRVTDDSGGQDTHSADIMVEHAPPLASFTVTPQQHINPLSLDYLFDASASSNPEGGALSYDWDFDGDGNWDVVGGTVQATHSYPNIGVYQAKLRVTNAALLSATTTQTVYCPSFWSSFGGPPGCTTRCSPIIGAQTNHVKWSFSTGAQIYSSPAIGADGTIYISSSFDGHLYALQDNGSPTPSLKWSFALGVGDLLYSSPAVGSDGTVYVGSYDGNTYALADNGTSTPTVKWSYPTGHVAGSSCIGPDGTVYIGSEDHNLYALVDNGSTTPSVKWAFLTGYEIVSTPALGRDGTVYIGSLDHNLYALVDNGNPTPTVKWSFTTGGGIFGSPAIGSDGTVYIGSEDHSVYALRDNGTPTPTVKWTYTTSSAVESSPALGPDGTVYFGGSDDNTVYALHDNGTATPTVQWSFITGGSINDASPVVGADGTVYIGSNDGNLYALFDTGTPTPEVKWSYALGFVFGGVAIGPDGTVYCGAGNNAVYAFGG